MSRNQSPNVKHKREDSAITVEVVSASGAAPAADTTLGSVARGVIIQTAGNLVIKDLMGKQVTLPLPAGQFSICIQQIIASGSTAQGVTLLF